LNSSCTFSLCHCDGCVFSMTFGFGIWRNSLSSMSSNASVMDPVSKVSSLALLGSSFDFDDPKNVDTIS
jgi:hypothetical protein